MFSSKLRSWMENHIVRPRKKSSKNNKNSLSNTNNALGTVVDPKRTNCSSFNVYQNNSLSENRTKSPTTISNTHTHGSMAGSNSSTTGGCSSVISSPARRREVSPIQNHTPSRYGWQSPNKDVVQSPKSDTFLHTSSQTKWTQDSNKQDQFIYDTISVEQKDLSSKVHIKESQIVDCSSSSISSLSWSTGSKEPIQIKVHNANEISNNTDDKTPNIVHYEEIYTVLRNPVQSINNDHSRLTDIERPKSDQPVHCLPEGNMFFHETVIENTKRKKNNNLKHYGKLLPSRITNTNASCGSGSIGSVESLHHFQSNNTKSNLNINRTSYPLESSANSSSISHSALARYKNSSMPTVQGNNGPLHSLSSPESAYSSYSDGTSPVTSASNANVYQYTPPEYYINMRTGVHYFPKNANSLAIEAHRYKISLNKIEEMSPIDPLPKTSFSGVIEGIPLLENQMFLKSANEDSMNSLSTRPSAVITDQRSSHTLMPPLMDYECKLHTSPSPRQRCRIRTNPWYSTSDTVLPIKNTIQVHTVNINSDQLNSDAIGSITCLSKDKTFNIDISSGLGSSNYVPIKKLKNTEGRNSNKSQKNSNYEYMLSEEETSSSTTMENLKNTIKRKYHLSHQQNLYTKIASKLRHHQSQIQQETESFGNHTDGSAKINSVCPDVPHSDDDTTLNEMMGKFDESYVYEKETDILSSDSDPTNCLSELDTGQDACDECDTDDFLDIDFIDTSSIQEVHDRKQLSQSGDSCSYYSSNNKNYYITQSNGRDCRVYSPVLQQLLKKSHRKITSTGGNVASGNCRRKRFMKTRKKSVETREQFNSPVRKSRETRSVGGTPICLRKKNTFEKKNRTKTPSLSNRSSSLVFTEMPHQNSRMTVADSEKALIKADLEADVKYRQLILEAESILVSLKSSVQSIPRDTPIVSPRRLNPLSNKRVEMLKNSESSVEPKRESHKQQTEQDSAASIHKRIEVLKYEAYSAPSSPKLCRLSPRKTHLTNFIQQNTSSESLPRKFSLAKINQSQVGKEHLKNLKKNSSLLPHRRVRNHFTRAATIASKLPIDSDSESEKNYNTKINSEKKLKDHKQLSVYRSNKYKHFIDDYSSEHNSIENITSKINSHNVDGDVKHVGSTSALAPIPFDLIGFDDAITYCPQSEPLKRKVYKNSFNFGNIKQGIDLESEIPKQALLSKINHLRRERFNLLNISKFTIPKSVGKEFNYNESIDPNSAKNSISFINKKQLILNTIADLKRNLEEQSVELNGLNDNSAVETN